MIANLLPPLLELSAGVVALYIARRSRFSAVQCSAWHPPAICLLALALLGLFTLDRSLPIWDSAVYFHMASKDGLFAGAEAPFCYRVLTPLVAKVLPVPLPAAFEFLNQVSIWGASLLTYALSRRRGISTTSALLGACFVALSAFSKFVLWYRFGVDQLAILGTIAVVWATLSRRFVLVSILGTLALLAKESVLLLLPFTLGEYWAVTGPTSHRIRRLLVGLSVWGPAIAVLVLLRASISCPSGMPLVDTLKFWAETRLSSPKAFGEMVLALPKAFGAIPLVLLIAWRRTGTALRIQPHLTLTVIATLLAGIFGASDYERVYFLAIPLVLVVFLPILDELSLGPWQLVLFLLAHFSLLDVFARPDFMDLPRWFMVNTGWPDLGEYAAKVAFWFATLCCVRFPGSAPENLKSPPDSSSAA